MRFTFLSEKPVVPAAEAAPVLAGIEEDSLESEGVELLDESAEADEPTPEEAAEAVSRFLERQERITGNLNDAIAPLEQGMARVKGIEGLRTELVDAILSNSEVALNKISEALDGLTAPALRKFPEEIVARLEAAHHAVETVNELKRMANEDYEKSLNKSLAVARHEGLPFPEVALMDEDAPSEPSVLPNPE